MMATRGIVQVISLGRDCQPAFQIRRYFGKKNCPSGVFDFQVTPHEAAIAYLENDFRGFFQRQDLEVHQEGYVWNRRYGTRHLHEFPNGIDEDYDNALARHNHLCENLRKVFRGRLATLIVARSRAPDALRSRLSSVIRNLHPRLPYELLVVDDRPDLLPSRPDAEAWQGNDDYYWNAFELFPIVSPDAATLVQFQLQRFVGHLRAAKF